MDFTGRTTADADSANDRGRIMSKLIIPEGYSAQLEPVETQRAIKKIKDYFYLLQDYL